MPSNLNKINNKHQQDFKYFSKENFNYEEIICNIMKGINK